MEKQKLLEIIVPIVASGVLSGTVLNGIVTHILYNKKLKKEQRIKFENMIGDKIVDALLYVKELTKKSSVIEIYGIDEKLEQHEFSAFDRNVIYPEIMNSDKDLQNFLEMIRKCRENYEEYLDCAIVLQIVYIDRYICELIKYYKELDQEEIEGILPALGTILIIDIQKWQKNCDKMLIRRLNKAKCKMEVQFGRKYNFLRKRIVEKQWEKSQLYVLINGPQKKKDEIALFLVQGLLKEAIEKQENS